MSFGCTATKSLQYNAVATFFSQFLNKQALLAELCHELTILLLVRLDVRPFHLLNDLLQVILNDTEFITCDKVRDDFIKTLINGLLTEYVA